MNYRKIVEELEEAKIINLMREFGVVDYVNRDEEIIFPTICHNASPDGASKKLYYYKDNHFFYCYTHCGGLSIFRLLQEIYRTRNIEYDWYSDIYEKALSCTSINLFEERFVPQSTKISKLRDTHQKIEKNYTFETYPKGILNIFTKTYPAQWLEEGISKAAMDKYEILFSIPQDKIILPHFDVFDNLIGIRGRALDEWEVETLGKYMPVEIEGKWYKHRLSLNLYGLNKTKEYIKKKGFAFVFEGEKSVLLMDSLYDENPSVAVCGSRLNKFQLSLLLRETQAHEVIICFDKEEEKNDEYFEKLYKMCQKYTNYANFSFLYDMEGLLELKDSPIDKGRDVFERLVNRRIAVK